MTCKHCQRYTSVNELLTYNGRCEDCYASIPWRGSSPRPLYLASGVAPATFIGLDKRRVNHRKADDFSHRLAA